jgi:ketosteroid isomerase-like protein
MSAKNKEIVVKVDAAFAENNVEGFLSFCADEIEWTMVGDRTVKGKEEIRRWLGSMGSDPPSFSPSGVIAEGNFVSAYGNMKLKDKSGEAVQYSYCDIYRFRGDKIIELRSFVIKIDGKSETK